MGRSKRCVCLPQNVACCCGRRRPQSRARERSAHRRLPSRCGRPIATRSRTVARRQWRENRARVEAGLAPLNHGAAPANHSLACCCPSHAPTANTQFISPSRPAPYRPEYEDISSASNGDELPPIWAFTKNQQPSESRTVRIRSPSPGPTPPPPPTDLSNETTSTVRFADSPPPQSSIQTRQRVGAARGRPRATPYQRPPPPPERSQPTPPPRVVATREEESAKEEEVVILTPAPGDDDSSGDEVLELFIKPSELGFLGPFKK